MNPVDYKTIDPGVTREFPVKMQTVEVAVNLKDVAHDYAKAFVDEAFRLNYDKAKYVQLEADELASYLNYLLLKRVDCVYGRCSDFRQLKLLWIPSYFQFVLSTVGIAIDQEVGLRFVPYAEGAESKTPQKTLTFAEALSISDKIAAFKDELHMVQDAMPRDVYGDLNVMASALIREYVCSSRKLDHPTAAYVSLFLDMRLKEELTYQMLYRRNQGDPELMRQALINDRRIY